MNTVICNSANQNSGNTNGDITVGEALCKCCPLLSTGWSQKTAIIYMAAYRRLAASIWNVPVSQISMSEHIEPILRCKDSSSAVSCNKNRMTREEYLLRRLFWTIAATEGFANPFEAIPK